MDSTNETLYVLKGTIKVPGPEKRYLKIGDAVGPSDFPAEEIARLKRQRWIGPASAPKAAVAAVAPGKRASGSAPWNLNPAELAGKDLETLKVMIAERDPQFDLSEITETEEAVAFLSRDFAGVAGTEIARVQG